MKSILLIVLLFFASNIFSQANGIAAVDIERNMLTSKYLDESREYQVYLPPSYHVNSQNNYPVVYLIDGDYNFHTDTGIIELLSSTSGRIPEMIVVGISDRGNSKYRENCAPEKNAHNFISYISKELKLDVNKKYRTSSYDLLIGHSLGGLFTTHFMLQNPEEFDVFIAIDPSFWWNDYAMISEADKILEERKELKTKYITTLADTKGMGVQRMVGVLDKYDSSGASWTFNHYPEENHGSVALLSIKDGLTGIFKDWEMSREEFYSLSGAQDVIDHYLELNKNYDTSFLLPSASLGNIVYYYFRKDLQKDLDILENQIEEHFPASLNEFYQQWASNLADSEKYDEAEAIYQKSIAFNPRALRSYEGLSKLYLKQGKRDEAKKASKIALTLGKELKARQWLINELKSQLDALSD